MNAVLSVPCSPHLRKKAAASQKATAFFEEE